MSRDIQGVELHWFAEYLVHHALVEFSRVNQGAFPGFEPVIDLRAGHVFRFPTQCVGVCIQCARFIDDTEVEL